MAVADSTAPCSSMADGPAGPSWTSAHVRHMYSSSGQRGSGPGESSGGKTSDPGTSPRSRTRSTVSEWHERQLWTAVMVAPDYSIDSRRRELTPLLLTPSNLEAAVDVLTSSIAGLLVFVPRPYRDNRGFFSRTFDADIARRHGVDLGAFAQDSMSRSARGVIRGLHLRAGDGEAKLVRCSYGEIFDVVVDLRPQSPTFLQQASFRLRDQECQSIYIPAGCAARIPGTHRSRRRRLPNRPPARSGRRRHDRLR